jgi:hypothetical protein
MELLREHVKEVGMIILQDQQLKFNRFGSVKDLAGLSQVKMHVVAIMLSSPLDPMQHTFLQRGLDSAHCFCK